MTDTFTLSLHSLSDKTPQYLAKLGKVCQETDVKPVLDDLCSTEEKPEAREKKNFIKFSRNNSLQTGSENRIKERTDIKCKQTGRAQLCHLLGCTRRKDSKKEKLGKKGGVCLTINAVS